VYVLFVVYKKYYLNDSAGICLHRSELLRFYHLSYQEKQVNRQKPNSLDQYAITLTELPLRDVFYVTLDFTSFTNFLQVFMENLNVI